VGVGVGVVVAGTEERESGACARRPRPVFPLPPCRAVLLEKERKESCFRRFVGAHARVLAETQHICTQGV
jgi:hypothetical protein